MPKRIRKHLQFYLSKIKTHSTPRLDLSSNTFSSSKGWILRGCKPPKTPSFSHNAKKLSFTTSETDEDFDSATLADIDRFLSENFKSLYLQPSDDEDDGDGKGKHTSNKENGPNDDGEKPGHSMFEAPRFLSLPPNMTGPYCRYYMNRSLSGSLVEEIRASMASSSTPSSSSNLSKQNNVDNKNETNENSKTSGRGPGPDDFITMTTFSMNPCNEFKRSMLEMVEARLKFNGKVDWEFMEELLFCYLDLNDKKSSKFIPNAFVDLIVFLRDRLSDNVLVKSRSVVRSRRKQKQKQKKNDNGNVTYV